MDITKIDKNFASRNIQFNTEKEYLLPSNPFKVLGGYYESETGFIKMPVDYSQKISQNVEWANKCSAGVRILFGTNSKKIKVTADLYCYCLMNHMASVGSAGFSLCKQNENNEEFIGNFIPPLNCNSTFEASLELNNKNKVINYCLYLPLYSGVKSLKITLDANSIVTEGRQVKDIKPILYYGSSITQGGCASRPDNAYQSIIYSNNQIDFLNFGISGGALAQDLMVEWLAKFDSSLFVCEYDWNAPDAKYLEDTHQKLYVNFRKYNAETPIIFLSMPDFKRYNDVNKRFKIIAQTYKYAKSLGDNNVYLIDGRKIFPKAYIHHCSVDGCHPTDLGFYFMAKKLQEIIDKLIK